MKFNLHPSVFSYKDSYPGLKENFLNLVKNVFQKSKANITCKSEILG